jgi:hypothetical protein
MAKTPRVDLSGLSLGDAEASIMAMIDAKQEASLGSYETTLIDFGADREEIDTEPARYRGQSAAWRDEPLACLLGYLARGGGAVLH